MHSDEQLFTDGSDVSMTQLIGRYERPLYRFLVQMTGDAHLAEDLFQETFLRLHRSRGRFHVSLSLKAYLYTIALNAARDALSSRTRTVTLDSGDEHASIEPADEADGPMLESQHAELRTGVRRALNRLPDAEREVVILRLYEGLSFAEIAQVTRVPLSTAKSRLLYALRRLRPALERFASDSILEAKETCHE